MTVTYSMGSTGKQVREIQGLLNTKFGSLRLKPDGHFGPKTKEAVIDFQKRVKLKSDGIVGPRTLAALHSHRATAAATPSADRYDFFSLSDLEDFFASLVKTTTHAPAAPATGTKPSPASPVRVPAVVKATDFKNFQRIGFAGYAGQGYVIKEYAKFEGSAIQLLPTRVIVGASDPMPGGIKNECAQFVQYFGIPRTNTWRRGPRVCDFKPGELPRGTVVATLRDGKYYSDYSGRSHVGIYLNHDDYSAYLASGGSGSITLLDQWNGTRIGKHSKSYKVEADKEGKKSKKSWTDAAGIVHTNRVSWTSDGEEYYVLLT
jgi:Putative peptidoglycan binding domain